ncbi:MAG TPA: hypothetical protein PLO23_10420 [Alphaproteobacteria bacterium]|nr:hypothetical protein [Alphaproteobacteria bacterium]
MPGDYKQSCVRFGHHGAYEDNGGMEHGSFGFPERPACWRYKGRLFSISVRGSLKLFGWQPRRRRKQFVLLGEPNFLSGPYELRPSDMD